MPPHHEKKSGIIYISHKFDLAIHLCACGCGTEAVMAIPPAAPLHNPWNLIKHEDGTITFSPSILNRSCKAHYFIERNRVRWC